MFFTINKLDIVLIEVVNILLDFYKYYIMTNKTVQQHISIFKDKLFLHFLNNDIDSRDNNPSLRAVDSLWTELCL